MWRGSASHELRFHISKWKLNMHCKHSLKILQHFPLCITQAVMCDLFIAWVCQKDIKSLQKWACFYPERRMQMGDILGIGHGDGISSGIQNPNMYPHHGGAQCQALRQAHRVGWMSHWCCPHWWFAIAAHAADQMCNRHGQQHAHRQLGLGQGPQEMLYLV